VSARDTAATAALIEGLQELGYSQATSIAQSLIRYGEILLEANTSTNLSGARSMADLVSHHFLDSLAPLAGIALREPIVDAGSGAGLPGIPYALAHEHARVVLIEPRRLRAGFLASAVARLKIGARVTVLKSTCETAGRSSAWRERAGTVLMRAVAKPALALELGAPLLQVGGSLFLYRGRESLPSLEETAVGEKYGVAMRSHRSVAVPHLEAQRHIWVFRKVRKTPEGYPRPSGRPPLRHAGEA
jgi:16S rRNA (guanine527-N7)-methyltransferase